MPRFTHFDIAADDPQRAMTFYHTIFGWEFTKWDGPEDYWMVKTGEPDEPGINGGLMPRTEPSQGIANTVGVDSVDAYLAHITAHGGTVVMPKMPIVGVGHIAYCTDTEGNVFGVFEDDPDAPAA